MLYNAAIQKQRPVKKAVCINLSSPPQQAASRPPGKQYRWSSYDTTGPSCVRHHPLNFIPGGHDDDHLPHTQPH